MDNVCHSLAGAAIAQAGFARRLPRATLLGIIAANIPDVDAVTYLGADNAFAVSFRRGWTHGLPALIVWAVALSLAFAWWARRRPISPAGLAGADTAIGSDGGAAPRSWRAYLPLAAIAVVSHPSLDWLNNYGVRLLMPFSNEWFYGDTLFIVDPTLIGLFALGWFASSRLLRAGSPRAELAARAALTLALVYIAAMKFMSESSRAEVERRDGVRFSRPDLMVAPEPLSFTRRLVMQRTPDGITERRAVWNGTHAVLERASAAEPTGVTPALTAAIRATRDGERFLRWSRFPYFVRGAGADSNTVFVGDARYSSGTTESWAGIRVPLK